ncbi:hypothetical protein [Inquilinus limosus]|uniref:hypothetical protein n=1 Tax=Inquilinus limosus TaxID=171674 RepID=UPI0011982A68|nr:hypothetical protein [Inquilinus limosus]
MDTLLNLIDQLLDWSTKNHIGDASGLIGLVVTGVGFFFTIKSSRKARDAAIDAKKAANKATKSINLHNDIVDMSTAIVSLEEIAKKIHDGDTEIIDRIFDVRKRLIMISRENGNIDENGKSTIKNTIVILSDFSNSLTMAKLTGNNVNLTKVNKKILNEIDALIQIFSETRRLQMENV